MQPTAKSSIFKYIKPNIYVVLNRKNLVVKFKNKIKLLFERLSIMKQSQKDFTFSDQSDQVKNVVIDLFYNDNDEANNNIYNFSNYSVQRRKGDIVKFDLFKISVAITKAYIATYGQDALFRTAIRSEIVLLTKIIAENLKNRRPLGGVVHIEEIQDQVELALMKNGQHEVARNYVLYREQRAKERIDSELLQEDISSIMMLLNDGTEMELDINKLSNIIKSACVGLEYVDGTLVLNAALQNMYDGISEDEVLKSIILASRQLIEMEPNYNFVTARLLAYKINKEVLGYDVDFNNLSQAYKEYFVKYINIGIENELLNPKLADFDLSIIINALNSERDHKFKYLGLQTLYDRYFIHINGRRIEMPQIFFMRVAMGLSLNEEHKEQRAIEFYNILSNFDFMSSTPTLFNSGTMHSQLSSCYLTTVGDDLGDIYDAIKENALLSKYAGGLGNDWSNVRGMGSIIKGTNGNSQGVIPFLKVVNDSAVAVNQCFSPDTYLFTSQGVKKIKDLSLKDLVLTQSGDYSAIKEILAYNQTDKMVEINIQHSITNIQVTAGHPFYVINNIGSCDTVIDELNANVEKLKWVDAGELKIGDYVAQVIPKEIVRVDNFSSADARFYGIMLANSVFLDDNSKFEIVSNDESYDFILNYLKSNNVQFSTRENESHLKIFVCFISTDSNFKFNYAFLHNANNDRFIMPKFMHLPVDITIELIRGLLEHTIINVSNILFINNSYQLVENLRFQLLRLSIACTGSVYNIKDQNELKTIIGDKLHIIPYINGKLHHVYVLEIPPVGKISKLFNINCDYQPNYFVWNGFIFSKVNSVNEVMHTDLVYDLIIDGESNYMTVSALAHNGGKRKGAVCVYLETWHLDIEEFLELRKNTGDDRRRCHDMNSANWVPDLFMKRVFEQGEWTLFSPNEVPDLHDKYGKEFERLYKHFEELAKLGKIKLFKKIPALQLWRKMLSMLFETGHPWITFKDPCNIRSPQQHVGVVHSSNLCTEITLNTNKNEIAVCNLGSVNLVNHMKNGVLDIEKVKCTINTAVRMLDNVIDINFYPVKKAQNSNLLHRPIGLGIMGFQDCLHMLRIPYCSEMAVEFADNTMEVIAYYTYLVSSDLAIERGKYKTYEGSLWSKGVLPLDSLGLLKKERDSQYLNINLDKKLDWDFLRAKILRDGMRNSNCVAIAPTATIANIVGISASIEPTYQNLFVKSNLSGEFTVVNEYLVSDLKRLNIWDPVMLSDIKYFDGSLTKINRIPDEIKAIYSTAFEIDTTWIIKAASRRQKWIDQSQSLNLYLLNPSGKKIDDTYKFAWVSGLKTTYYLRTLAATSAEKSTGSGGELNSVYIGNIESNNINNSTNANLCAIDNPECESCQ